VRALPKLASSSTKLHRLSAVAGHTVRVRASGRSARTPLEVTRLAA